jgi:hypothetical protein
MKDKWQKYKPFDPATSASYEPFQVRKKGGEAVRAHFNQFGQLLCGVSGALLGWEPDEMTSADAAGDAAGGDANAGKASGQPGDS